MLRADNNKCKFGGLLSIKYVLPKLLYKILVIYIDSIKMDEWYILKMIFFIVLIDPHRCKISFIFLIH